MSFLRYSTGQHQMVNDEMKRQTRSHHTEIHAEICVLAPLDGLYTASSLHDFT